MLHDDGRGSDGVVRCTPCLCPNLVENHFVVVVVFHSIHFVVAAVFDLILHPTIRLYERLGSYFALI